MDRARTGDGLEPSSSDRRRRRSFMSIAGPLHISSLGPSRWMECAATVCLVARCKQWRVTVAWKGGELERALAAGFASETERVRPRHYCQPAIQQMRGEATGLE